MRVPSFLWWLPIGESPEIPPQEFQRWLDEGHSVQVVDARTRLEYQSGTIGNAKHAPLTDMPHSLERLPLSVDTPVVVLCLSGHRSIPGTRWLRNRGYQAFSLQGGIMNWKRQGFQVQTPQQIFEEQTRR